MAEAVMLVCDECGRPDATPVTIRAGSRNYVKDLCPPHLRALLKDTRTPRRGRRRRVATQPLKGTARKRKAVAKRAKPAKRTVTGRRQATKPRSPRKASN
jgi:hypothetical protein